MPNDADLEISLYRLKKEEKRKPAQGTEASTYQAIIRYQKANSNTEPNIGEGEISLDIPALRLLETDKKAYGQALSASLFADPVMLNTFKTAVQVTENAGSELHLRLLISSRADELHNLIWESMSDPRSATGSPLLTKPNIHFSRYFRSSEWGPIRLHEQGQLNALVVVANPTNLNTYSVPGRAQAKLPPIDVTEETNRACGYMQGIHPTVLASDPNQPGNASLKGIIQKLVSYKPRGCDILYIVCHGAILTKPVPGPYLYLEDENGAVDIVDGVLLIDHLADLELEQRPRLVVFASCQSGGSQNNRFSEDGGAFMPIGPRLVEAGIPAVLAMQDNVSMDFIGEFMPAFFTELSANGMVDRAVNVARRACREEKDAWMPVLFMRLRGGLIWRGPGYSAARDFDKWSTLGMHAQSGMCLPILGPGMIDPYVGSRSDLSSELARRHSYPLLDHDRDNLPLVTQFLTLNQDQQYLFLVYMQRLQKRLNQKFPKVFEQHANCQVEEGFGLAYQHVVSEQHFELHLSLAELRQPLYITTNPDRTLALAIQQVTGELPHEMICPWRSDLPAVDLPAYSKARPLVYYLFGNFSDPLSLVLTQDDYFDFLIAVTRNEFLIPKPIQTSLLKHALLFLGFPIEDWGLRLLFRYLVSMPGSRMQAKRTNIAVQLDPEDQRISEPERARKFFQEYFKNSSVEIYWGPLEEFLRELNQEVAGGGGE